MENDLIVFARHRGVDRIADVHRFERQFDVRFQPIVHKKIQSSVHTAEIVPPIPVLALIVHILHKNIPDTHIRKTDLLFHHKKLLLHVAVQKRVDLSDIDDPAPVF